MLLALIVAAVAVAVVVLMASGSDDSPDEQPSPEGGASTSRSPSPSFGLPTELLDRAAMARRFPPKLPSGFPSDLESLIPSIPSPAEDALP
jgi:hypothetical protein